MSHHAEVQYQYKSNLTTEKLYDKATSAVQMNGSMGEWFRTAVGVRQGCLQSPTLFFSNGSCLTLWKNMIDRLAMATETLPVFGLRMTVMI